MDVKITGVKETAGHFKKVGDRMQGKAGDPLRQAVHRGLLRVERATKGRLTGGNPLHVRTGRLRASILVDTKRIGKTVRGEVGTDVFYGKVHEFGLKGMKKRPFLGPSFKENVKLIRQDIARTLKVINGK